MAKIDDGLFDPSLVEPRLTAFIPHTPTPRQAAFLLLECLEASTAVPAAAASPMPC